MPLLKSISGIRGTIGGQPNNALTPIDIASLTAGYGSWLKEQGPRPSVLIGRDGRVTGPLVQSIVTNTLLMQGIDVIDAGLSTTPTIAMGVPKYGALGGIIITASHNPMHWNALKLLNAQGEFLSQDAGQEVLTRADALDEMEFAEIEDLGFYSKAGDALEYHIEQILQLGLVNATGIRSKKIKVVLDPINSSGSIAIKAMLDALGVHCEIIHGDIKGVFGHDPEPLAKNLADLSDAVRAHSADIGISVDPDVDRLALVCETGEMFGEENTLVAVSDYILSHRPGPAVSNLSSTRGLRDVASRYDQPYYASAVGEVNVVQKMKACQAVIGGEGNGGVIVPNLHYGRDALAGLALFLSYYVEKGTKMTEIKNELPRYYMAKMKVDINTLNPTTVLDTIKNKFINHPGLNTVDGIKIDFENNWVHLRKSNTEPVIRIYTEALTQNEADHLAEKFKKEILS